MAALTNSGKALYAALSESIYRRSGDDQRLVLADIKGGLAQVANLSVPGLQYDANGGYYWVSTGPMAGFVAQVVRDGTDYIVVFRGTDSAASGWASAMSTIFNGGRNGDSLNFEVIVGAWSTPQRTLLP